MVLLNKDRKGKPVKAVLIRKVYIVKKLKAKMLISINNMKLEKKKNL